MSKQPLTIDAHVVERLQKEPLIWLSTVRSNLRPHLVPVWFLWHNNDEILIFSQPENQKIRNIRQNPHVALALEALDGGEDVVLLDGTAEILSQSTLELMPSAYIDKYGQTMQQMGTQPEAMAKDY